MTDDPAIEELLSLIDRLESLLDDSELSELEVEAGGTTLVLRRPSAFASLGFVAADQAVIGPSASAAAGAIRSGRASTAGDRSSTAAARDADTAALTDSGSADAPNSFHAVLAPLTGVFYAAPSPGATPYVRVGGPVARGQVIGLIEAMKLFNEIKSDIGGTVRRIAAESGALVKARQPLIEVEPS